MIPALEASGHAVYAPQLSAQDRAETTLSDHAAEVAALIEEQDLNEVLLVGHSYGGMVITAAAERVPERLARLVYLDAWVPFDGESAFMCRPEIERAFAPDARDGVTPPIDPWFVGVETEEQAEIVRRELIGLSLRCWQEPVRLESPQAAALPRSFVFARHSAMGAMAERALEAGYDYHELETEHMAPLTDPVGTAGVLMAIAG